MVRLSPPPGELLGAHVSTQGGVHTGPGRAAAIGATALQLFTKTPNQWREPAIDEATRTLFRQEMKRTGMRAIVARTIRTSSTSQLLIRR